MPRAKEIFPFAILGTLDRFFSPGIDELHVQMVQGTDHCLTFANWNPSTNCCSCIPKQRIHDCLLVSKCRDGTCCAGTYNLRGTEGWWLYPVARNSTKEERMEKVVAVMT
jgi:hypothetical protein